MPFRRHDDCVPLPGGGWSCWPESATRASTGPSTEVEADLEILRLAAEHFRHDLRAFWDHSNYFLIIQGALFTVFASVIGPQAEGTVAGILPPRYEALALAGFGLIFGLFWGWVAWRRGKLIQRWRENVMHVDGRVDRHGIYLRIEPDVGRHWWYGPSAFTVRLPWIVCVLWVGWIVWLWLFVPA